MGLASTLKPNEPFLLSANIMSDEELTISALTDNTIGTNPETLWISIENQTIPEHKREALKQITHK